MHSIQMIHLGGGVEIGGAGDLHGGVKDLGRFFYGTVLTHLLCAYAPLENPDIDQSCMKVKP